MISKIRNPGFNCRRIRLGSRIFIWPTEFSLQITQKSGFESTCHNTSNHISMPITMNAAEEMYGLARLQKLVADNAHLVPRDLIQRIITETEAFLGTARHPDDICIVTAELH